MEIQQTNQNSASELLIILVGKELYKLNTVVNYPYSDDLIELMSKNLIRLTPTLNLDLLSRVIDKYLIGLKTYNKDGGLSQIIAAIKVQEQLEKENKW